MLFDLPLAADVLPGGAFEDHLRVCECALLEIQVCPCYTHNRSFLSTVRIENVHDCVGGERGIESDVEKPGMSGIEPVEFQSGAGRPIRDGAAMSRARLL